VGYRFTGTDAERAARGCTGSLADPTVATGFDTLATNVLALDIQYLCSSGTVLASVPDTTSCPTGSSYVRSAVVSVVAASDTAAPGAAAQNYTLESGTTVTCGPDVMCAALTQEVLLPNLKDR
ncbi:MAG: prepilin, partial [Acidimicrobiia bacterium]